MRLRPFLQTVAAGAALAVAAPALAHDGHPAPGSAPAGPDTRPEWRGDGPPPGAPYAQSPQGADPRSADWREGWLADCRSRVGTRDNGVGGAVIGGVVGGVLGNRIAGHGHRTVGTVAGTAVGAIAGAAIDKAEDSGRAKDQCEAWLDSYYASYSRGPYSQGYPGYGYGYYGYPAFAYVPVQNGCCQAAQPTPNCVETVEYEYVDAPARRARIIRRAPDKRVRIAPDKRIRAN
jgi:hypothetical protein